MEAARAMGGPRGRGGNRRWGASVASVAESLGMSWSETKALGTLVKTAFLFLVTFPSAEETSIIVSWVRWGKDRVGLIVECFHLTGSFSSLLGLFKSMSLLEEVGRSRRARGKYDDWRWRD